ncbi:MAG: O-antigen ligase family protein [Zavarzinella sp.]
MHWLLIGYMFLFIHRPFEFWPMLGEMHIERVYIILVILCWLVAPGKRWIPNPLHAAYLFFATCIAGAWLMSPWADRGQIVVENWFKILVFYFLLVTSVSNRRTLRLVVAGFLCVMFIYMLHSLKEYVGGRHTYRMGIVRMLGIDSSLGDPNSFGASIVFALPVVMAFWHSDRRKWLRAGVLSYIGLSILCILLTGSRSSLLGLVVWGSWVVFRSKYRYSAILAVTFLAPMAFFALPDSLQTRFETIVNPDVGPENARTSGEGRLEGFFKGFELLAAYPLTGVGPGAWRPATGSSLESHNLYGQLAGELGFLGIIAFSFILWCFYRTWKDIRQRTRTAPQDDFVKHLNNALMMGLFLLLFEGNFGHNLLRHNWLWYGGFLLIARYVVLREPSTAPQRAVRPAVYQWHPRVQAWQVRWQ